MRRISTLLFHVAALAVVLFIAWADFQADVALYTILYGAERAMAMAWALRSATLGGTALTLGTLYLLCWLFNRRSDPQ